MLIIIAALIAQNISPTQGEECYNETIEDSVTEFHNELRRDFATKDINKRYGDIPGSKSLFKLKYDCGLAALAGALIPKDCSKQARDLSPLGVSSNFRKFRTVGEIVGDDIIEYYNVTVEEWATKNIVPLESDVIYKDKSMEAFANMIYYKSIAFGCMHKNCINEDNATSFAIACVYGSAPKIGEQLYIPNPKPKNKKGCTAHKTCKEVVSDGKCMTNEENTLGPLCESNMTEVDVETTSSTASTQSTSTTLTPTTTTTTTTSTSATETTTTTTSTTPTTTTTTSTTPTTTTTIPTTGMTQEMRDKVIQMINYRRSQLAKGLVRNGIEGNPNCAQATNMYQMRYDMTLEAEAQAVADTCQDIASGVATTSGQNAYVMSTVTLPLYDVLVETQKVWWSQITKNGINAQMHYTQFLETKPLSPSAFTQMAWARSYKVGCGIKRCSFGTSVVCRYSPRGNIIGEYIYNTGSTCASCSYSCSDGLCPAPAN
ncbi:unnamed protein product [Cylicocyclus nassatus]|uniref:SCP domain-containing protein n=1 Tax=Cylicocyclus nassatus TaxID=53992 RepID=A0AA36M0K1_CYLNA|nr:unnamed protein product [Cylicocyclus nassatus]